MVLGGQLLQLFRLLLIHGAPPCPYGGKLTQDLTSDKVRLTLPATTPTRPRRGWCTTRAARPRPRSQSARRAAAPGCWSDGPPASPASRPAARRRRGRPTRAPSRLHCADGAAARRDC